MAGRGRPDLHERFVRVVRRGLERAERELQAERRPRRRRTTAERKREHWRLVGPPQRVAV